MNGNYNFDIWVLEFLYCLNRNSDDYVLVGDSALYYCYGLDRHVDEVEIYCRHGIDLTKLTDCIVGHIKQNYFILDVTHQSFSKCTLELRNKNIDRVLKLKLTYRSEDLNHSYNLAVVDGLLTCDINALLFVKINSFVYTLNVSDFLDILYLYYKHKDSLTSYTIPHLKTTLSYYNIDCIKYLFSAQSTTFGVTVGKLSKISDLFKELENF